MKISRKEAEKFADSLDFKKGNGLIPAIAQSESTGEILMLAFQNREALLRTLTSGKMYYYSRSRKKLWRKGEKSGNTQKMLAFYPDCDRDAILYKVFQKGAACHKGTRTCFSQEDFPLERLFEIIEERKRKPKKGSYTNKLLRRKGAALEKLGEEFGEVVHAVMEKEGKKALIWESADLLYHLFVLLAAEGVSLREVEEELKRRHSIKSKGRKHA